MAVRLFRRPGKRGNFVSKGERHEFVPCRMKFDPVDALAEAIMRAKLRPIAVSESGELLRLRIASVGPERNGLVGDPGCTAGDNPLQHSVVGKGIPAGSWPRLIKDFMGRTGVNVHCCLLCGRLSNGELLLSRAFSGQHDTQFDGAAVLSAFIKQETCPTSYPPSSRLETTNTRMPNSWHTYGVGLRRLPDASVPTFGAQLEAFPFRMTTQNLARHADDPNTPYWEMLKTGSDAFLATERPPTVAVCDQRYVFNPAITDKDCDPSKGEAKHIASYVPRWGVWLAADLEESKAWAIYRERQKRFASLIGDREPIVLRRQIPGMGRAKRYIITIADDNRAPLDKLCKKLNAASGTCDVLLNSRGD
jgi:hypothetical protein